MHLSLYDIPVILINFNENGQNHKQNCYIHAFTMDSLEVETHDLYVFEDQSQYPSFTGGITFFH